MAILPAPPPRKRRSFVVGLAVGLLVAVASSSAILLTRGKGGSPVATQTISPSVSPSPSASPSATPQAPPAVVRNNFNNLRSWSRGTRVTFGDLWITPPDKDCTVRTYKYQGKTHGAFEYGCRSWQSSGYNLLFFYIGFKNTSTRPVTLVLQNLVLESRDGRSFAPVNVRSKADFPTSFMNASMKLPPGGKFFGSVTFDGHVNGLVPASISYIDGKQTLVQTFAGTVGSVPASG